MVGGLIMDREILILPNIDSSNYWENPKVKELICKGLIEGIRAAEFDESNEEEHFSSEFMICIGDDTFLTLEFYFETLTTGKRALRITGTKYYSDEEQKKFIYKSKDLK